MSKEAYAVVIVAAGLTGWLLVMLPSVIYLLTAWRTRRDRLIAAFTPTALRLYHDRFYPSETCPAEDQLRPWFRRQFSSLYGRRCYVAPLVLLGAASGVAAWAVACTVQVWTNVLPHGESFVLPQVAFGAVLGGVAWVIVDQLARFRSRDFTPHDVYVSAFRLLLSIPLGYSVGSFVDPNMKVAVAFLLGAFPTKTLSKIGGRLVSQKLGLGEERENGHTELEKLQGIGRTNAERFRDEGVTSIVELAWCDPVDLTIRTNRDFNFIVDCVSQALWWVYMQDQSPSLYALSLRGAQEAHYLLDCLLGTDAGARARAEHTVAAAATVLNISPDAMRHTLITAAEDPFTLFLVEVWAPEPRRPAASSP